MTCFLDDTSSVRLPVEERTFNTTVNPMCEVFPKVSFQLMMNDDSSHDDSSDDVSSDDDDDVMH